MDLILYPASATPAVTPSVSAAFKQQATKVMLTIALFLLVYVLILAAVIGLAIGAGYCGLMIVLTHPSFFTLILGAGLVATGVSLVYFVVKFVTAKTEDDDDNRILLTRDNEPMLFEFLDKLTTETNTPFPHRVYLSADVNAAVTRKVNVLNLFFPAQKNLVIGVGLINAVNISEFKAIIGHEFGHFSQKSLRLGAWIYNMNRIIYNMLYENKDYVAFLNAWGKISSLLALMAHLTVKLSAGIQWILRGLYTLINKSYLALSREMEYHADDIASVVAGSNHLLSGLQKAESADYAYHLALQHAGRLVESSEQITNLYAAQGVQLQAEVRVRPTPRIVYTDQWASHPSWEERANNVHRLHCETTTQATSAWSLFADPQSTQTEMSHVLYAGVRFEGAPVPLDNDQYRQWWAAEQEKASLPAIFKGFYDNRPIDLTPEQLADLTTRTTTLALDEIFSAENTQLPSTLERIQADRQTAEAIAAKQIDVKTFDFDGKKYAAVSAQDVAEQLRKEAEATQEKIARVDQDVFSYFYQHSSNSQHLLALYTEYGQRFQRLKNWAPAIAETLHSLESSEGRETIDTAVEYAAQLQRFEGETLDMAAEHLTAHHAALTQKLARFGATTHAYFVVDHYVQQELTDLYVILGEIATQLREQTWEAFKRLLETLAQEIPADRTLIVANE